MRASLFLEKTLQTDASCKPPLYIKATQENAAGSLNKSSGGVRHVRA
jgi:hypothetical protein